jgi:hypothetical protein
LDCGRFTCDCRRFTCDCGRLSCGGGHFPFGQRLSGGGHVGSSRPDADFTFGPVRNRRLAMRSFVDRCVCLERAHTHTHGRLRAW